MRNAYTADVPVALGGRDFVLRYDFAAIGAINTAYPGQDPLLLLAVAVNTWDVRAIAALLAAGLRRHHGDMTADQIMDLSPAIAPVGDAMRAALIFAAFGPDGPPQPAPPGEGEDGRDPPMPAPGSATS